MNIRKLKKICKKYLIDEYVINKDGSIDVNTDLFLSNKNISNFKIKFNKIDGSLFISNNFFKNFKNFPNIINGDLYMNNNMFENLNGIPKNIKGKVYAQGNNINTLIGNNINIDKIFINNKDLIIKNDRKIKINKII